MPNASLIGLQVLARTLSVKRSTKGFARPVYYHPRSDYHSKVTSVLIAVDLIQRSAALRRDLDRGLLVMGVNAQLQDHGTGRMKDLDLVLGTPGDKVRPKKTRETPARSLGEQVDKLGLILDRSATSVIAGLPHLPVGPIGQVRLAVEAKACMTKHRNAGPRIYDELTSSHTTIHGNSPRAISAGFVMVNTADAFLSPTQAKNYGLGVDGSPFLSKHRQPEAAAFIFRKLSELQIRGGSLDVPGFDGLAVVAVTTDNDTSGFAISEEVVDEALQERFAYSAMINRVGALYDQFYGGF